MRLTAALIVSAFFFSCNSGTEKEIPAAATTDSVIPSPVAGPGTDSSSAQATTPESVADPAAAAQQQLQAAATDTATESKRYRVMVFKNNGQDGLNGYGYDIFRDDKIIIRQPHIPAIPGNHGFATPAEADKTGRLMMRKLMLGIMPPTVSVEELDSMGVKH
jgi:hypothetical protein